MSGKPYKTSGSTSLSDFKQLALLGEGAYSAVYKVLRLADGEIYALKKVKLPSLSDKEKQNALNEVRLLASILHGNVIAYKEAFFDDKTRCLCIITECADGGDLFQQIVRCQKERSHLPENDVWRYLHGMCHGLKALHDMRILHRDLKPANVFLNSTPEGMTIAKLADFNVSKVAKRGLCMTQTGTPYYASPEVWRDMPYDAKSDMWSLGCVLYELVALRPPFRAEDMEGLYRKVLRGQYPRIPPHYSQDLSEVLATLLQVNPRHRPSIDQLIDLPVMKRHAPVNSPSEMSRPTDLLNTIKLPKNAIDLSTCLPKPRYNLDSDSGDVQEEGAGDIAAGAAGQRQMSRPPPPPSGPGMPLRGGRHELPPVGAYPPSGLDSRVDSYLSGAQGDSHDDGAEQSVPDTLDAYLQQQQNMPPPLRQPQPPAHHPRQYQEYEVAGPNDPYARGQRELSQPRGRRGPDEYSDRYSSGGQGAPPPRYAGDPMSEARRASPAPSSHAHHMQPVLYGGRGRSQPREQRRQMAQYARPQYAPSQAQLGAQQQSQAALKQSGGAAAGLRLPRIFSRGG
mmetsp:Transcript_115126/g.215486  ORF Transcript_115126/g.215486 Transcript_115126/m.215486 type:complete len:566 (+) Transcript_115126:138-1835(+)